jgi:hypothetical protein
MFETYVRDRINLFHEMVKVVERSFLFFITRLVFFSNLNSKLPYVKSRAMGKRTVPHGEHTTTEVKAALSRNMKANLESDSMESVFAMKEKGSVRITVIETVGSTSHSFFTKNSKALEIGLDLFFKDNVVYQRHGGSLEVAINSKQRQPSGYIDFQTTNDYD